MIISINNISSISIDDALVMSISLFEIIEFEIIKFIRFIKLLKKFEFLRFIRIDTKDANFTDIKNFGIQIV